MNDFVVQLKKSLGSLLSGDGLIVSFFGLPAPMMTAATCVTNVLTAICRRHAYATTGGGSAENILILPKTRTTLRVIQLFADLLFLEAGGGLASTFATQ